jgi:hypothetical protein
MQLRLWRGWTNCSPSTQKRRRLIGLTGRHALRQERAKPLLDDIRSRIEAAQSVALPIRAHPVEELTRFLEYPELELSNNLAENSMRPVALGRKNWIHIGSPQAGPKVAAILSVVESCRRLKLPVRDYQFSPGLPISRSYASQTLLPLRGSRSIHRRKRPGLLG